MVKYLKNIWDCIRFPFLYPRNRFTGLHYNNWDILEWIRDKKKESSLFVHLNLVDNEPIGSIFYTLPSGEILRLEINDPKEVWVVLEKPGGHWERVVSKLKSPSLVLDAVWGKGGEIITWVSKLPEEPKVISSRIIYRPLKWIGAKIMNWLHSWPLQLFHCIPSYTEFDGSLETGWRKAFGENLCKDLRRALWKEGGLKSIFRFRVTQIKEKYGYLHFYYCGGGQEVEKVISKYEDISSRTCIICGKPATWISQGWISPYCDDCVPNKDSAEPINKKEEGSRD